MRFVPSALILAYSIGCISSASSPLESGFREFRDYYPLNLGLVREYEVIDQTHFFSGGAQEDGGVSHSFVIHRVDRAPGHSDDRVMLVVEESSLMSSNEGLLSISRYILSATEYEARVHKLTVEPDRDPRIEVSYDPPQVFVRLSAVEDGFYQATHRISGGTFSFWPVAARRTQALDHENVVRAAVRMMYHGTVEWESTAFLNEAFNIGSVAVTQDVTYLQGIGPALSRTAYRAPVSVRGEDQWEIEIVREEKLVRFQPSR